MRFAVAFDAPPELLACDCSICARQGFLHLILTAEQFTLLRGADVLSDYRFGTRTARHLFCSVCGIKSFYVPRTHPDGYSVNWRALDDVGHLDPVVTAFDGRDWDAGNSALRAASTRP